MNVPTGLALDIDSFITSVDAKNRSQKTLTMYRQQLGYLEKWLAERGVTEVEAIKYQHLERYMIALRERGLKASSIHAAYRCFKAFLNWYERVECVAPGWRNPARQIEGPQVRFQRLPPAPEADILAAIKTCSTHCLADDRDRAIILLLLDTGIRANECVMLNVEHLDFRRKSLLIVYGKGMRVRTSYPSDTTLKAIAQYLRHRSKGKSEGPAPDEPLWLSLTEPTRLTYWGLRQMLDRRSELAGLAKPLRPHAIRRTFATVFNTSRQGTPVDLQHLLGHANLQCLNRYVDVDAAHLEKIQRRASPVAHLLAT